MKTRFMKFMLPLSMAALLAACGQDQAQDDNASQEATSQQAETSAEETTSSADSTASTSETTDGGPITPADLDVSLEEAVAEFQSRYPDAQITDIEIDDNDGGWEYDIAGFDADSEYEITVDGISGEVLEVEAEAEDHSDDDVLNLEGIISVQEAIDIATEEGLNGVESMELERDDDFNRVTYWNIESQGNDLEIKINAETGEVLARDN